MGIKTCCGVKPAIVGEHSKYGPLNRCPICRQYWLVQSNKFWEEVLNPDESPHDYSKVFYGPGELGLANAVLCGARINQKALDVAEPPNANR